MKKNTKRKLPGDLTKRQRLEQIIRVDHAGEYGARRIYAGQLAVLKGTEHEETIRHMAEQEEVHLAAFSKLLNERGIRPTALNPLWHVGGWLLGAGTAALGSKAAMACTVAVEEAIDEHYAAQVAELEDDEKPLKRMIEKFRLEELEHRDTGLEHGAEQASAYKLLYRAIKGTCKIAIKVAERV